jgi:phosphoadenosine phosphosulfate reductase
VTAIALYTDENTDAREALRGRLRDLNARAAALDAKGLLTLALKEAFPERVAVVSSFAAESVVLLHLAAAIDPATPILFLNTGKLFGETLRYRDRLQDALGLTDIRAIGPHPIDRETLDPLGTLWSSDADACCHFRKTKPLARALKGFEATVTGRKRFQTAERANMEKVELADGRFRFNPLVDWTLDEISRYLEANRLPIHPLVNDGYPSIGCMPCTRRVSAGGDYRSGRWAGLAKDECGMHAGLDGEGI